ncbi:unnamed protein product [Mytilus edulis]|uniref:Uncharacterized protein n=1 Tax=Mytilus edulis TaxID=6550 RepID=A0A8S3QSM4_MYTED|nr:unnamed protein product [Mytilus edulis]
MTDTQLTAENSELINMPVLQCPIDDCNWKSQDLDEAFAAALTTALQIHDRPPTSGSTLQDVIQTNVQHSTDMQWKMHKTGMTIRDIVLPTALFYCCDTNLRTDIMRDLQGDVASMIETDLLKAIKRLAVKEESTLVQLSEAKNHSASIYKATCKELGCNHIFDYSDEIIKENLVRGIADPEIMSDLLGDSKTDRTLEETVSFIAQKEQGKVTRSAVGDSASAMSALCNTSYPKRPQAAGANVGLVVVLLIDRGMIARPGLDIVRRGYSHVLNAQLKVITPNHAANALHVEYGATVLHLLESALKVRATGTRPIKVDQIKIETRNKLVIYMSSCALHQNRPTKHHVSNITYLMDSGWLDPQNPIQCFW